MLWLCIGLPGFAVAQAIGDTAVTEVSSIQLSYPIGDKANFEIRDAILPADSIWKMPFGSLIPSHLKIDVPYTLTGKTAYLRFNLFNASDSVVGVYFFPGFYYRTARLFKSDGARKPVILPQSLPIDSGFLSGYNLLKLAPNEHATFFAQLQFVKSPVNFLAPKLINKGFVYYFKNNVENRKSAIGMLTYVVSGILLMMIFYSLAVYLQTFSSEFLFYAAYALLTGLLLFLKSFLFGSSSAFNNIFEGYLDFMMQGLAYICYFIFVNRFLNTKQHFPFLNRLLRVGQWILVLLLLTFTICYFFSTNMWLLNMISNGTKQFLILMGVIFIVYGMRQNNKLMNYLVAGQAVLIFFGAISILLIINPIFFVKPQNGHSNIFNDSLLYYEIGLMIELVFFLSGLAYKNKRDIIERVKERERLKLDNERQEFDKQVAVLEAKQEERNRISADMHDELGSGVTAIRLMSEIVKAKMKDQTLPEIERISSSANELLNKMNTIIWTMISSNDSVESLVAYIRAYAAEFFENTPVRCILDIRSDISPKALTGEKRRGVFLAVKEALNNILKHAQATEVILYIDASDDLIIRISDNGRGIDVSKPRAFGNGMTNMKKRIEQVNGIFHVESYEGTSLTFKLKL